jgi:predicted permease
MAVLRDVVYALRRLGSARVFTATAVLTLALGIGGTTAIFTLMHAVMLKSLPVSDPGRLYRIGDGDSCCVQGGPQDRWGMFSFPLFEQIKAATPEFESITAFQAGMNRFSARREGGDDAARTVRGIYVTGGYFTTLGVNALAGRVFTEADDAASAPPVAVLAYHAWQGKFGGDPSLIGSTLVLEGHPFTVAGVMPQGFFGETLQADPPDLWVPLEQEPMVAGGTSILRQSISSWLRVIGRLKPGATTAGMDARLTSLLHNWARTDAGYPQEWMPLIEKVMPQQLIAVVPAGAGVAEMKAEYGRSLQILLGVCGLVLLIACANVANLLLARSVARRGQTAVRIALGASRREVIREALVESVLLSVAGAGAGLAVAMGAARLLLSLAFSGATYLPIDTTPSWPVLGFATALAVVTGLIFGAAPAWFETRTDPIDALRGAGRSTGDTTSIARRALLVVQATLSVVLVAGSTMLGRSLNNLEGQQFGFDKDGRILVSISRPSPSVTGERLTALYRDLEQRLARIPGVRGAGLALYNPLTDNWGEGIVIAGKPPVLDESTNASWDRVSPGYLQQLGVKLAKGRFFNEADNETSEHVAVVNRAFVRRFFEANEDPIDRRFGLDLPENASTYRIVGVVDDPRFAAFELNKPQRPMFYVVLAQTVKYENPLMARLEASTHYAGGVLLVSDVPLGTLLPAVSRALSEADPNLAVASARTLDEQIARVFSQERMLATLAALFGVVALVLAAVGLYGVTAYTVAQRTNEIGLRMALGADRQRVAQLVLGSAFRRVAAGLLLGLPMAVGAGYLLSAQLYGVTFWDPVALTVAAGALALAALVAALVPASRAVALAPMAALRTE